jgi:hypothetical protein
MTMQVQGLESTLKVLQKIQPEVKKQFFKDAKQIVRPAVDEAKGAYRSDYLSGMSRAWKDKDRGILLFPYNQSAASKGVAVQTSLSKKQDAVLTITQKDIGASILDMAGKRSNKRNFGSNLTAISDPPSRVMWRAYENNAGAIEAEMQKSVDEVMTKVNALEKLVIL